MQTVRQPNIVGKDQRESGLCDYHAKHGKDTKLPSATVPIARAQRPDTLYEQRSPAEVTKKLLARSGARASEPVVPLVPTSPLLQSPPQVQPAPVTAKQKPEIPSTKPTLDIDSEEELEAIIESVVKAGPPPEPPHAPQPIALMRVPATEAKPRGAVEEDVVAEDLGLDTGEGEEEELDGPWRVILDRVGVALANSTYEKAVDPRRIRQMPGQPRTVFNPVRLRRLRKSMEQPGQIQPITLRRVIDSAEFDFELVDGERRWRSALEAGTAVLLLRAMVVEIDDEAAQYVISVLANFNREEHTALEASDAIVQMHDKLKVPMMAIVRMFGKSLMWVNQRYSLRRLVPEVRELLDPELPENEQLTVTAAIRISTKKPETQLETARRVMRGELQVNRIRSEAVERGEAVNEYRRSPSHIVETLTSNIESLRRGAIKVKSAVVATEKSVLEGTTPPKKQALLSILAAAKEIVEETEIILSATLFPKPKVLPGQAEPTAAPPSVAPAVSRPPALVATTSVADSSIGTVEVSYFERIPGESGKSLVTKRVDVVFYGKLREAKALKWQADGEPTPKNEIDFCARMGIRF